jgi:rhomboid protease GluP
MTEALVALRSGLTDAEAQEVVVLLAALDVPASIVVEVVGLTVCVAERDVDRAERVLADDDARQPHEAPSAAPEPPPAEWIGPQALVVLLLAAICFAVFAYGARRADPFPDRMLALGAISAPSIERGEWWRFFSAIFVHFDGAHLAVNMATLLVLGPPLAVLVGPLWFALIFLLSGCAGNALSYAIAPIAGLKAGASGAIAGVLGALAGVSLARRPRGRFRRWQILGALAAVYALVVGAGPGSDHVAHLGGLLAGIPLGFVAQRHRRGTRAAPPTAVPRPLAQGAQKASPLVPGSRAD